MKPRQPSRSHAGRRWQFHQAPTNKPGRCGGASPGLTEPPPHLPGGGSRPMPADALKCKECQTTYPLEARFVCERCFGPLEVSYTPPDGDPAALKRRIQAGPHTLWRYADFLPLEGPRALGAADGLDAAGQGRPPGREARARRALHQERDREPDALVQGPRRLRRAGACTGARLRHARVCAHGQPRERRRGARRGRRDARLRADPARPRGAEGPRHGRLRRADRGRRAATTTTSTGSAPRSRASGRAGRS